MYDEIGGQLTVAVSIIITLIVLAKVASIDSRRDRKKQGDTLESLFPEGDDWSRGDEK